MKVEAASNNATATPNRAAVTSNNAAVTSKNAAMTSNRHEMKPVLALARVCQRRQSSVKANGRAIGVKGRNS